MSVGLPGTGIGGLFYLLCAFWMPFRELARAVQGGRRAGRGRVMAAQFGIGVAMAAGIWASGWVIGLLFVAVEGSGPGSAGVGAGALSRAVAGGEVPHAIRVITVLGTLGLLAVVLGAVEVARFLVRGRGRGRAPGVPVAEFVGGSGGRGGGGGGGASRRDEQVGAGERGSHTGAAPLLQRGVAAVAGRSRRGLSGAESWGRRGGAARNGHRRREGGAARLVGACVSAVVAGWPSAGAPLWAQASAASGASVEARQHLARGDSALRAGDRELARREYRAALDLDSGNSRAAYQLAGLLPAGSAEAVELYELYVALEPQDAWGFIALGDALSLAGLDALALEAYDSALALEPGEPDVLRGRAHVLDRAGHTDGAVAAYEAWLAVEPGSAAGWRRLGRARERAGRWREAVRAYQHALTLEDDDATVERLRWARARAAPAVAPTFGGSLDSEENQVTRAGLRADVPVGLRLRLGVELARTHAVDGGVGATGDGGAVTAQWRPRGALAVEGALGVARVTGQAPDGGAAPPTALAVLRLRARWRAPADGPAAELRLSRAPVAASPALLARPVVAEDARAVVETAVWRRLRVRGVGRLANLDEGDGRNRRSGMGGALVARVAPTAEISGQYHRLGYANPSPAGYFAFQRAEVLELGTYTEYYGAWPFVVAVDAAAGAQRVTHHLAEPGTWTRALRLWALVSWNPAPPYELGLELEAYESPIAHDGVAPGAGWRYASASLSVRRALP